MMDDPDELMNRIQPFFPHDPSLAISVVSKLFPSVPMWIAEMIVFEFFYVLGLKAAYQEYLTKFKPYDDKIVGKSRDFSLSMDLSQPINLN